jgi:hypothetical protein
MTRCLTIMMLIIRQHDDIRAIASSTALSQSLIDKLGSSSGRPARALIQRRRGASAEGALPRR